MKYSFSGVVGVWLTVSFDSNCSFISIIYIKLITIFRKRILFEFPSFQYKSSLTSSNPSTTILFPSPTPSLPSPSPTTSPTTNPSTTPPYPTLSRIPPERSPHSPRRSTWGSSWAISWVWSTFGWIDFSFLLSCVWWRWGCQCPWLNFWGWWTFSFWWASS